MTVTIYHNPRCSKSRETLQILEQQGQKISIINYQETPPDAADLEKILDMLGLQPRDLMRKKEAEYKALGLDNPSLGHAELVKAMVEHPKLIERPIVINGKKAVIGRPPQKVLDIL